MIQGLPNEEKYTVGELNNHGRKDSEDLKTFMQVKHME